MSKFKNQVVLVSPKFDLEVTNPIAQVTPGEFDVSGTQTGDTGWLPNFDEYSIEQEFSGELQDFGSEEYTDGEITTVNGTTTSIENGFNVVSSAETRWYLAGVAQSTGLIMLTFNAKINSGSISFGRAYNGTSYDSTGLPYQIKEGVNRVIITSTTVADRLVHMDLITAVDFDIDFTNISVKGLTTKTQRKERRRLTHDASDTDKLYIEVDDSGTLELQPYTPSLPDPTVTIKANQTASIGYADTIDTHYASLKCYKTVII